MQGSKEMKRLKYLDSNVMSYGVLLKLPARKLHWLKAVCNEWRGLISERSFVQSHSKNKEPLTGFFFQEKYQFATEDVDRVTYISIDPVGLHNSVLNFLPGSVVILSSCNGLMCCRSTLPSPKPKLFVCNPLTKEWTSLDWKPYYRSTSAALVFDPVHLPFVGASTNYQIVVVSRATGTAGEAQFEFDIYSSLTGNWRRSTEKCACKRDVYKNRGIYVDGVLYWLTYGDQILMFDPKNEMSMLIRVPIPFADLDNRAEMCIGESGGKLHYVLLSNKTLQLWILKDAYESVWDLSISEGNLEVYGFTSLHTQDLRFLDRGGGIVDLLSFKDDVLAIRYGSEFYAYEFKARKMEKLCKTNQLGTVALTEPIVLPYSMSLAPLA